MATNDPNRPFSKSAGTSLGLGIVGGALPVVGLLLSLGAIIFGHLAIHKISHSSPPFRGKWAAVIGLITGYLAVIMLPIMAAGAYFLTPIIQEKIAENQQEKIDLVMEKGRELWKASEEYAADHGDRYPANWTQLAGKYLSDPALRDLLEGREIRGGGQSTFRLVPHERPILPALHGTVIVMKEEAIGPIAEVVVIYDDGSADIRRNSVKP